MPHLYIALEREIPKFDHHVNGHTLSRYEREMAQVAAECGVKGLMEFFGMSTDDVAGLVEDAGGELSETEITTDRWFPAADGLATVRALLDYLQEHPKTAGAGDLAKELETWQDVLSRAAREGVRWRLEVEL